MQPNLSGPGNHLHAENRIAAEAEKIILNSRVFDSQQIAPDRSKQAFNLISRRGPSLALTTLGIKEPGDPVNLEVDVIAKYVERLLGDRDREDTK